MATNFQTPDFQAFHGKGSCEQLPLPGGRAEQSFDTIFQNISSQIGKSISYSPTIPTDEGLVFNNFVLSPEAYENVYNKLLGATMDQYILFTKTEGEKAKQDAGFLFYILSTGLAELAIKHSISDDSLSDDKIMRQEILDRMNNEKLVKKGVVVMVDHKITKEVLRSSLRGYVDNKQFSNAYAVTLAGKKLDTGSVDGWNKIADYTDGMLIEAGYSQYKNPILSSTDEHEFDRDTYIHTRTATEIMFQDKIVQDMWNTLQNLSKHI